MASYTFTMPDGQVYDVTAPDGMSREQVQAQVVAAHAQNAPPPEAQGGGNAPSWTDYLRANPVLGAPVQTLLRSGQGIEQLLAHGAADVSDLGGYAPNPVAAHLHAMADAVDSGVNNQNADYEAAKARVNAASTSPALSGALRTTGEFAGNLLNPVGAAGGMIRSAPGMLNAVLKSAASGGAFGTSQPVLNSPDYWANKAVQTGVGAGLGGVAGALAAAANPAASNALTTAGLKAAASDAYQQAADQGVTIRQPVAQAAVTDIADALNKRGIDPALQPKTTAVMSRFAAEVGAPDAPDLTLDRAETLRRIANSALDSPDKSDRAAAHVVIDKWDDFIGGLKPGDVTTNGDPQATVDTLTSARDLYARSAKAQTLENLVTRAQNAVGANYTTAGYETALRQQFRSLANNDAAMRRFTPDEQQAILGVVRGGPVENALRYVGKLAVRGPLSAIPAGAAFYSAGPEGAAALAGAGEAGKWAATQMALGNVNKALDLVRAGGTLPAGSAQPAPSPAPGASVISPVTAFLLRSILQPRAQQ